MINTKKLPISDGVLQLTASKPSNSVTVHGWAGNGNQMYKIDSPGAVPSTAIFRQGMAFSVDGGLYTTTATPGATSTSRFGNVIRNDGAVHIDTVVSGSISFGLRRNSNGVWITT